MKYRVFWSPHAELQLEKILRESLDHDSIVETARNIDRILLVAPAAFGESRFETVRIAFMRPLGIQFEILEDVSTVIVYDVWRIDRRRE